jgi:hypothetical protein
MSRKFGIIILLFFIGVVTTIGGDPPRPAPSVSLVSLIATPDKFDGQYIRVHGIGFFDPKHSLSAIFLTRDDKLKGNRSNGFYLYLSAFTEKINRLNNRFIVVQGVFRSGDKGHLDSFQGSLVDIDRIEEMVGRVD